MGLDRHRKLMWGPTLCAALVAVSPSLHIDSFRMSTPDQSHTLSCASGCVPAPSRPRVAAEFAAGGFDVIFDDDSAGEAADLVCMQEREDHIRLAVVHCKFSGRAEAGERVKDVVEVASQAVRSAWWKWRFKDRGRHVIERERRLRTDGRGTRFLQGTWVP
jgi:hypothetical protein